MLDRLRRETELGDARPRPDGTHVAARGFTVWPQSAWPRGVVVAVAAAILLVWWWRSSPELRSGGDGRDVRRVARSEVRASSSPVRSPEGAEVSVGGGKRGSVRAGSVHRGEQQDTAGRSVPGAGRSTASDSASGTGPVLENRGALAVRGPARAVVAARDPSGRDGAGGPVNGGFGPRGAPSASASAERGEGLRVGGTVPGSELGGRVGELGPPSDVTTPAERGSGAAAGSQPTLRCESRYEACTERGAGYPGRKCAGDYRICIADRANMSDDEIRVAMELRCELDTLSCLMADRMTARACGEKFAPLCLLGEDAREVRMDDCVRLLVDCAALGAGRSACASDFALCFSETGALQ